MILDDNSKTFEKPESGMFLGTIADFVDLGTVDTKFGAKRKVRIVWVLDKNDSEGAPFRVIFQATASLNEKAKLYEIIKNVLGQAPAVPFDSEVLIGRSNQLYVAKEKDPVTGKEYANVKLVAPLPTGAVAPAIPKDFVRAKDKANQSRTGTTSQAPAQANPVQKPVTQPAPAAVAPTADASF